MHSLDTWGNGWHYFPVSMMIIILLIMTVLFIIFYRRRRYFFNNRFIGRNWGRDWIANCCRPRNSDSASDILIRRYVRGEINKEEFDQIKRDIFNQNDDIKN